MTLLRHLLFVLAYAALAALAGLAVWRFGQPPVIAGLSGAVVLLALGLVHEIVGRVVAQHSAARRLRRLADAIEGLVGEIARRQGGAEPAGGARYDSVVAEVRLLQTLVGQLSAARGPAPAAAVTEPLPVGEAPVRQSVLSAVPFSAVSSGSSGDMLDLIRAALTANRVDVLLQPIVSLPQRKHRHYEVFSRIRDQKGEHIMPDQYLAVAERAGLIATIDNLLLLRCIQLIRETQRRQQHIGFFSNVSAATLGDREFMTQFLDFMAQNPSLTPNLVFEMSQEALTAGGAGTLAVIDGLARMGVRFSMDQVEHLDMDFGELLRHNVRYLKIEASSLLGTVAGAGGPQRFRELKRQLDRSGIDLIVEKIETEQQLVEILDLQIDYGQGYLFGEPRPSRADR